MVIGVIVDVLVVLPCVVVDHIFKLALLVVEPSQIFIDGLVMDESVHQIIGVLR
jgi:hypothetical protein